MRGYLGAKGSCDVDISAQLTPINSTFKFIVERHFNNFSFDNDLRCDRLLEFFKIVSNLYMLTSCPENHDETPLFVSAGNLQQ